jgi:hypothetical protein
MYLTRAPDRGISTPNPEQPIADTTDLSRLSGTVFREVHLMLLGNAIETGYLLFSNRDSAIGEAALLA